jgi:hypothetical protein
MHTIGQLNLLSVVDVPHPSAAKQSQMVLTTLPAATTTTTTKETTTAAIDGKSVIFSPGFEQLF